MQTVKMFQYERNLDQLCSRNRECYGGSPCLQIQLAFTIHLSQIVVVSFYPFNNDMILLVILKYYLINSLKMPYSTGFETVGF